MSIETDFHWGWQRDGAIFGVLFGRFNDYNAPEWFFGVGIGLCAVMFRLTEAR